MRHRTLAVNDCTQNYRREWERYTFKVRNIRFLMMSDRNDLPYPVGRKPGGGASPAGAVTPETFDIAPAFGALMRHSLPT
jgi:hypothetical protein